MPRSYATEAVVLGSHKLGEADRIVTLLTACKGKVPTVVKGVRKIKSRFGGRLEPFSYLQVQLYAGRNLHTLTGADTIRTHAPVRDNRSSLKAGLAVIDMIARSVPEFEQRPRTFNLLVNYLDKADSLTLTGGDLNKTRTLALAAQLKQLLLAGYQPHLQSCSSCGGKLGQMRFSAAEGGAICGNCAGESFAISNASVDAMRLLLERPLAQADALALDDAVIDQTWSCIREICRYHLGFDPKLKP